MLEPQCLPCAFFSCVHMRLYTLNFIRSYRVFADSKQSGSHTHTRGGDVLCSWVFRSRECDSMSFQLQTHCDHRLSSKNLCEFQLLWSSDIPFNLTQNYPRSYLGSISTKVSLSRSRVWSPHVYLHGLARQPLGLSPQACVSIYKVRRHEYPSWFTEDGGG
jgi:hypothetical protein